MAKRAFIPLALFIMCLLGGCYFVEDGGGAPRTSIDIQSMQTRNFDCSYKVAFAAVIDVFQDLGFIIQSSDAAIGLVIAKSSSSGSIRGIPGVSGVSSETSWETGTAHLEELGAGVSIRVSFVKNKKTSGEYGVVEERSYAITDGNFYTRFFEKIDKSIFVRKNLR